MAFNIQTTGVAVPDASVEVTIGPKFLELFSEQLYTSPNKTFEELISNSWDAQATQVRVGMSGTLSTAGAAVWVIDNGTSMDVDGFRQLWSVAQSTKVATVQPGRQPIGKFGIGKLATYVLAHELTYVCKAHDGQIRAVTMDYRRIGGESERLHIDPLPLPVRCLTLEEVYALLNTLEEGERIKRDLDRLIADEPIEVSSGANEFGGPPDVSERYAGTWTLAILTNLKSAGLKMQVGHIRRMLMASLPLGSTIGITFNGEPLKSTKESIAISQQWTLGPGLDLKKIEVDKDTIIEVEEIDAPYPHIVIAGLGELTGTVTLYEESIAGGKSQNLGFSNGYAINILGRVINCEDPYFGLQNLNHTAWAKFRAAIRADGLNGKLAINREAVLDGRELQIFRAFLKALFNRTRTTHDKKARASWPDAGDILTEAWGTVPLEPLRREIEDGLTRGSMPSFVSGDPEDISEEELDSWNEVKTPADVIEDITFLPRGIDAPLVCYDIRGRRIVINEDHPFVREHATTHEQQLLLRDYAMVELLTQAYLNQLEVDKAVLGQVEVYRDQLLRLVARLRRKSGFQIAQLLDLASVHPKDKAFETILGDALESLGFSVKRLGGSGNPEGVATAFITPGKNQASYSFTYDAKSSINKKVQAKDANLAGLVRHRTDHEADYSLVVGPAFPEGALQKECQQQKVTPLKAEDLAALMLLNATRGPISLEELRGLFLLYDDRDVHTFIADLSDRLHAQKTLSYTEIFRALENLGFEGPDMLTTPVIAKEIRDRTGDKGYPTKKDVAGVLSGLSIMAPTMVRVQGDNVFLGARPDKLREVIVKQLNSIPSTYSIGVDPSLLDNE
ncbi:ATP-binding protein [Acrocarpospora sp. B8E8]|uniref:ATP-binding protein n=1 Tax=Acrocarpospora sp. B8E8 TaxID=3153572 RepID=UPI00325EB542